MVENDIWSDFVQIWHVDILGDYKVNYISFVAIVSTREEMETSDWLKFRYCPILFKIWNVDV